MALVMHRQDTAVWTDEADRDGVRLGHRRICPPVQRDRDDAARTQAPAVRVEPDERQATLEADAFAAVGGRAGWRRVHLKERAVREITPRDSTPGSVRVM